MSKELKFIHITKCAGKFVENIGKKIGINWGKFHNEYGWQHTILKNIDNNLKHNYDWFIIVRNPYNRILSEYNREWGVPVNNNKEQINKYLINRIQNRSLDGNHYTEQFRYIDESVKLHIIKLENISNELPILFHKYNIKFDHLDIKNNNTYDKKNEFTIEDFNNELITLINTIYDIDFKIFNYEKIDINNKTELKEPDNYNIPIKRYRNKLYNIYQSDITLNLSVYKTIDDLLPLPTNLYNMLNKKIKINKAISWYGKAKKVKPVKINNEVIILKYHGSKEYYKNEKKIYLLLKNEDFLPKLKYFDDINLILGITNAGDAIPVYKKKNTNFSLKNIDKQLCNIVDKLYNKYKLYHNDLWPNNICIDNNNKIKLIDFDKTSTKKNQSQYHFKSYY